MIKILSLAGGIAGAVALSQFPEFSQQYLQRLAGQVDGLTSVVVDFDASALASGLGREEALQQMTGTPFLDDRQLDMRLTFSRHARLTEDLAQLRGASSIERLIMPHRLSDPETFAATWSDFAPALPVSTAGLVSAGVGFVGGWGLTALALGLLVAPWRASLARKAMRQEAAAVSHARRDPPVMRPAGSVLVPQAHVPRLMGQTR